jgi:hypothetical protein
MILLIFVIELLNYFLSSFLGSFQIELFIKHKPINMDEFRKAIPLRYRNEKVINLDQMKYINEIFDILELADE